MSAQPVVPPTAAPVADTQQPAPATAASDNPIPTGDPTQDAVANLTHAVTVAPKLASAPGAALDVATAGGDITSSAQAVQQVGDAHTTAHAAAVVHQGSGGGLWGALDSIGHDVSHLVEHSPADILSLSDGLLNAGMKDAQHQFRYLYDVYQRHGLGAALAEGLVIAGAAAAGMIITGGVGDAVEGTALAAVEGGTEAAAGTAEGVAEGAAEGTEAATDTAAQAGRSTASKVFKVVTGDKNATGFFARRGLAGLSSPAAAAIPANAAGYAEAHVLYTDSWNRTASATYRNKDGMLVNPGNVIAGLLGVKGAAGSGISGVTNGIFDLFSDPVNAGLSDIGTARSSIGNAVKFGGKYLPEKIYNGSITAEDMERQYVAAKAVEDGVPGATATRQSGALMRGLHYLADHNEGAITRRFPDLAPIAPQLAEASNTDEVMDVLRSPAALRETVGSRVPSMSLVGKKMADIRTYMANAPTNYLHPILGGIRHPTQLWGSLGHLSERIPGTAYDAVTQGFKKKDIDLVRFAGEDAGLLRQSLRQGLGEDFTNRVISLIRHSDAGTRHQIWRNAQLMTILSHAGYDVSDVDVESAHWFDEAKEKALNSINSPRFRQAVADKMDSLMPSTDPSGATGVYGMTRSGDIPRPLKDEDSGRTFQGANMLSQVGRVPVMDYTTLHHIAQKLSGGMTFTGSMDEFLMNHVTEPLFKRWILMSGGYALHISLSEMFLNYARNGIPDMTRASYYNMLGRMTGRVEEADKEEAAYDHAARGALRLLGVRGDLTDEEVATQRALMDETRRASMGRVDKAMARWGRILNSASRHAIAITPADRTVMDRTMEFWKMTGGDMATAGTLPHGSAVDDLVDPVAQKTGLFRQAVDTHAMKRGERYVQYGPEDYDYLHSWGQHLGLQAKDPMHVAAAKGMRDAYASGGDSDAAYAAAHAAALDSLHHLDPVVRGGYMHDSLKMEGDPASMTPLESWAHGIAEDTMAATHDGTDAHAPIHSLINNVAEGNPSFPNLLRHIPQEMRPLKVPGRELIPVSGNSMMATLATSGFKQLNKVVTFLSRQPLALAEFLHSYEQLAPLEESGLLTHDQLLVRAAGDSTKQAIKYIHNVQDRTVLDQIVRNWAPFFFAQEQAYRRMGRLLASDPGAFRRYELLLQSMHDIVSKQQDSQGNQYFALPGAGFLDHLTVGALGMAGMPTASLNPTGFGGTLSAANVVFPFANGVRPDLSPVVTLAAQGMNNLFQEFGQTYPLFKPVSNVVNGALTDAVGSEGMEASILQQVIPNTTAYRFIETAQGNDTSFNSAMMLTLQSLAYSQNVAMHAWDKGGRKGPMPDIIPPANATPQQLQTFLSRLKNQTRIVFLMRTIIGAVSPVSADVTVNDFGLNQDLQNEINKKGSVAGGFQQFLLDHPDATPYTVAKSETATGGSLPDTQAALDWVTQNQSLLSKYEYGGLWLMPQMTKAQDVYSSSAYYEEIASGLRLRDTPQQYLNALYAANGDEAYYTALDQHEKALSGAGKGTAAESQEYTRWDAWLEQFQTQNPIWADQYYSGQRQVNAQQSIQQLKEMYASKIPATQTAQGQAVGALLEQYQQAESQYMEAGTQSDYSTAQRNVNDQWTAWVTAYAQQNPEVSKLVSSVFRDALYFTNPT